MNFRRAIVKWNGGVGALLCSRCRVILAYGFNHKDVPHLCKDCKDDEIRKAKRGEFNEPTGSTENDPSP